MVILWWQRVCDCRYGFASASFATIDARRWGRCARFADLVKHLVVEVVNVLPIFVVRHWGRSVSGEEKESFLILMPNGAGLFYEAGIVPPERRKIL